MQGRQEGIWDGACKRCSREKEMADLHVALYSEIQLT